MNELNRLNYDHEGDPGGGIGAAITTSVIHSHLMSTLVWCSSTISLLGASSKQKHTRDSGL